VIRYAGMLRTGYRKSRLKGFTLVELLVVLSIIALLVALLLPALSKASELARRIVCAKQEQQMGLASTTYFNDFNKFWSWFDYLGATYWIYDGRQQTTGPANGRPLYWINQGMLYSCNYLKTPEVYYCPTNSKTQFKYDTYFYADKIRESVVNGTDKRVRTSYMCRNYDVINGKAIHVSFAGVGMGSSKTFVPVNTLKRSDSRLALLADTFTYDRGGHLNRFYNVLYADGHVAVYDDHDEWVFASAGYDDNNWSEVLRERAVREARKRFGETLVDGFIKPQVDGAFPLGWLFLDRR
jgi:prepilin-type N-terminal cleavage/methylation domain-containing protein/prepilin-type processing-associated H-X9-DG protein